MMRTLGVLSKMRYMPVYRRSADGHRGGYLARDVEDPPAGDVLVEVLAGAGIPSLAADIAELASAEADWVEGQW